MWLECRVGGNVAREVMGLQCRALRAARSEQWEPGRVLSRSCSALVFFADYCVHSSNCIPSLWPFSWLTDNKASECLLNTTCWVLTSTL